MGKKKKDERYSYFIQNEPKACSIPRHIVPKPTPCHINKLIVRYNAEQHEQEQKPAQSVYLTDTAHTARARLTSQKKTRFTERPARCEKLHIGSTRISKPGRSTCLVQYIRGVLRYLRARLTWYVWAALGVFHGAVRWLDGVENCQKGGEGRPSFDT